jgi:hypothetical protein
MNNNRRRTFRPRQQKNGFRRRNGPSNQSQNGHFSSNSGNLNFNRNGSNSNPFNLEKTIQKFQQLSKDAQSSGDPVLSENYLQHADHYTRKLEEINQRNQQSTQAAKPNPVIKENEDQVISKDDSEVKNLNVETTD